ncbi:MAG: peroxide stress protein YaaA [Sphingomonadaceae bacterium]|nr:peroxide stress protein YaaA [Sphingomonadaceae bacterium]
MLAVLSPAKTLDLDSALPPLEATEPRFATDAARLAAAAAKLSRARLQKLMHISPSLAALNAERFRAFVPGEAPDTARPALFTFAGDVYAGLRGPDMDEVTRDFAQDHVRILSGLYGLLRPLDTIQPYRLEMGVPFGIGRKKTLYAFWGDRIAAALAEDFAGHADRTLVNLASKEYFDAVDTARLPGRVLTIDFRDDHDGDLRFNTFVAKRARGAIARFLCEERLDRPEGLKAFEGFGYRFDGERSTDDRWLFVRPAAPAGGG